MLSRTESPWHPKKRKDSSTKPVISALAASGHSRFQWPIFLHKAHLVLFLSCSIRRDRRTSFESDSRLRKPLSVFFLWFTFRASTQVLGLCGGLLDEISKSISVASSSSITSSSISSSTNSSSSSCANAVSASSYRALDGRSEGEVELPAAPLGIDTKVPVDSLLLL